MRLLRPLVRRAALGAATVVAAGLACKDASGPGVPRVYLLEVPQGADQSALVGDTLPRAIVLRAIGKDGPVRGARVHVRAATGGGAALPAADVTDERGELRVQWRLGDVSRQQELEARVDQLDPVRVRATAIGRVLSVTLLSPVATLHAGETAQLTAYAIDTFGDQVAVPLEWSTSTPGTAEVSAGGRLRVLGEGTIAVSAREPVTGAIGNTELQGTDTPVGYAIVVDGVAPAGVPLLDVADSLALRVAMVGRLGRPMSSIPVGGPVSWSCARPELFARCDVTLRPVLQSRTTTDTVEVTARVADRVHTLRVALHEEAIRNLGVWTRPAPYWFTGTASPAIIEATAGDTLTVFISAYSSVPVPLPYGGTGYVPKLNRPWDITTGDPAVARHVLGDTADGMRRLHLVAGRPGTVAVDVRARGGHVRFTLAVRARATDPCTAARTMALDLAPGELRTVHGRDGVRCLRFDPARDAGRVYAVVADATPRLSGLSQGSSGWMSNPDGFGLYYEQGAPVPRALPTVRMYAPGWVPPATLQDAVVAQAPPRTHRWQFGDQLMGERPPQGPAPGSGAAARLQATAPAVRVGDTLVTGYMHTWIDPDLRTGDGTPVRDMFLVRYVGQRLVIADMLDVIEGRLVGATAAIVPAQTLAAIDGAYASGGAVQLERLFPDAPLARPVFGRDLQGRELVLNIPLAAGIAGTAWTDAAAVDWADVGRTGTLEQVVDWVVTHELAHVRHLSAYYQGWPQSWFVEGVADFAERMTTTARTTGTPAPSRTARLRTIGDLNHVPGGHFGYLYSHFHGYERSSFVLDYLADHAAARGADGIAAVRQLIAAMPSPAAADAAVAAGIPGVDLQGLVHRAHVALLMEQLRHPQCGATCLGPTGTLPQWTHFLQYDLTAFAPTRPYDARSWPVLRPGTGGGTTIQQLGGSFWPVFVDGRGATAAQTWILDFTDAPTSTALVVRIR